MWDAGRVVRAERPARKSITAESVAEQRALRAAAVKGGIAEGETVDFDATPIDLDVVGRDGASGPLVLRDGAVLVRWSHAQPDALTPLDAYLRDRVDLLVHPPKGHDAPPFRGSRTPASIDDRVMHERRDDHSAPHRLRRSQRAHSRVAPPRPVTGAGVASACPADVPHRGACVAQPSTPPPDLPPSDPFPSVSRPGLAPVGGRQELGQNFLADRRVIGRVVDLVDATQRADRRARRGRRRPHETARRPRPAVHRTRARSGPSRRASARARSLGARRARGCARLVVSGRAAHRRRQRAVPPHHRDPAEPCSAQRHWRDAVLLTQWEAARRRCGVGGTSVLTVQWAPWFEFALDRRVPAHGVPPGAVGRRRAVHDPPARRTARARRRPPCLPGVRHVGLQRAREGPRDRCSGGHRVRCRTRGRGSPGAGSPRIRYPDGSSPTTGARCGGRCAAPAAADRTAADPTGRTRTRT